MDNYIILLDEYVIFCNNYKRLNFKTVKAYKLDIMHYLNNIPSQKHLDVDKDIFKKYVLMLHNTYKPKTVKRKLASLKVFFKYIKENYSLESNFMDITDIKFREPKILPKIIPIHNIQRLFSVMYEQKELCITKCSKQNFARDIAAIELLFATGMRISELCTLKTQDIDLISGIIKIYGKGSKERILSINNTNVIEAMKEYNVILTNDNIDSEYYFINNIGKRLSEQSVRLMIKKNTKFAGITQSITPHMFRHSFATLLLEQDVDIRYIQKILGHSSINVTEIYTFVSSAKQREILSIKNPRKLIII